jgi:hypothetical protein
MKVPLIWKKLTQPSRLDEYQRLLELARDSGYRLTSLAAWYKHYYSKENRVMVLRHDVDIDPVGAAEMYRIEKAIGARATYYFRWRTMNIGLMRQMLQDGFEVGLHYETLATYCKKHNLRRSEEINATILKTCFAILKDEITRFKKLFGEVQTIASHGDKRNRLIGIPNHVILNHGDPSELGILFEAYDPAILKQFGVYISDSSIAENFAWKYTMTPSEAISRKISPICLLTHPEHWHFRPSKKFRSLLIDLSERLA